MTTKTEDHKVTKLVTWWIVKDIQEILGQSDGKKDLQTCLLIRSMSVGWM